MSFCLFSLQILVVIISCPAALHAGISVGMEWSNTVQCIWQRWGVGTHAAERPAGLCHLPLPLMLFAWVTPTFGEGIWMLLERKCSLAECFDIVKDLAIYPLFYFLYDFTQSRIFFPSQTLIFNLPWALWFIVFYTVQQDTSKRFNKIIQSLANGKAENNEGVIP